MARFRGNCGGARDWPGEACRSADEACASEQRAAPTLSDGRGPITSPLHFDACLPLLGRVVVSADAGRMSVARKAFIYKGQLLRRRWHGRAVCNSRADTGSLHDPRDADGRE